MQNQRDAIPDWRQREGTMGSCNNGSARKNSVCALLPPPLCTQSPCETIWCMYCCSHLSITTGGRGVAYYKALHPPYTHTAHAQQGIKKKKDMQKGFFVSEQHLQSVKKFIKGLRFGKEVVRGWCPWGNRQGWAGMCPWVGPKERKEKGCKGTL